MALQFDPQTGLLLKIEENTSEMKDTLKEYFSTSQEKLQKETAKNENKNTQKIIKSNEKNRKFLVKNTNEYNQKLEQNLKKINNTQKNNELIKTRDNKGRFVKQEKTASEKSKELKDTKKDDKEKIEVKIPAEEIGEAVGDAYYQSYHELKSFFTPFIESTKSIFQIFSKTLFSKDTKKDVKSASEKANKNKKQINKDEEILKTNKKTLETDEKILKELKHHRPKESRFNVGGILGLLKKILLGLAPLGLMWAFIKNRLKSLLPNRKDRLANSKQSKKTRSNNTKRSKTAQKKNRKVLDKEAKRKVKTREAPKSRKRIKIPTKVEKKAGLKVAGKIGSKAIPLLGWGLAGYDAFNTLHDMGQHKNISFTQAFKKNVLGLDVDYNPHLTKKQLLKIKDTKEAVKNGKSVLTPQKENEYELPQKGINGNSTWFDSNPEKEKANTKKTQKEDKTKTQQQVTTISDNRLLNAQLDTEIELLKQNLITNKLLEDLILKVGGKTISYSPTKNSLRDKE